MLQKGIWSGYYTFHKQELNIRRGFEKTLFEIEIVKSTENTFSGTVVDEVATGGTEGVGSIRGTLIDNRLAFVKEMPICTAIVDDKGSRKTYKRKHPKIYYTGSLSENGRSVSGIWRFKFGLIFIGLRPMLIFPLSGTWAMTFCDNRVRKSVV